MKRFISISLAALLGFVSAADVTASQDQLFLADTSDVKAYAEKTAEDLQRINCLLYDDLTFFDLRKLEQPEDAVYKVHGSRLITSDGLTKEYTINFCRRFTDAQGSDESKTFAYTHKSH
jgi:hypothetical protein